MKKINKNIAVAIAAFTLFNVAAPSVYALNESEGQGFENSEINLATLDEEVTSEDYKDVKEYFRDLHGSEDKFIKFKTYDNMFTEVNGAKGIIRFNETDSNGNIINSYDINIFENASEISEQMSREEKMRRATVLDKETTGSPIDKFSLSVQTKGNYKSDFKLSIGNSKGVITNYYKNKSWKTGNTKNFYDSLMSAQGYVSDIKTTVKGAVLFASVMSLGSRWINKNVPKQPEVIALLETCGIATYSAAAVGVLMVHYLVSVRNCGSYYNDIINNKNR